MLNIESASYYVPDRYIDLEKISYFDAISKNEMRVFTRLYGLKRIPVAEHLSLKALLSQSLDSLLNKVLINLAEIKLIIYAHTSKIVTPFACSIINEIKNDYGLHHALAFATTINNCASTLTAFEMAEALLTTMAPNAKAIIITGERMFTASQKVIPKISILGDASAAVLVSKRKGLHTLKSMVIKTDGASANGIWMTEEQNKQYEKDYAMIFSQVIHEALHQSNITLDKIRYILPHNVNLPSWKNVAKVLNISIDKIYLENIPHYSHCFGADIIINYVDVLSKKLIQPGDYYMMATVGLGSIYAAAVFQYENK